MNEAMATPKSLMEAVRYFTDDVATAFFVRMRWPDGVCCPHCGSTNVLHLPRQKRWKCREKHPRAQFSAKVGTIFEDSPLGLDKWFVAIWLITNAKNGTSSCELARALDVTQKSAWFMLHRVRHAMHTGTFQKFAGEVESDETYVGGKASNMHLSRRREKIKGTGGVGKAIVHGMLARGSGKEPCSKVKATVVPNAKGKTLVPIVREHVEPGSHVYTDALRSYAPLAEDFVHAAVDHAVRYVDGSVHTNGLENFWSLFKRCIHGTYVSIDEPHLQRYVDEEAFRFNERQLNDGQRFDAVLPGVVGRRLTYKALISASEGLSADRVTAGEQPN